MITNEHIEKFIAEAHRVGDAGLTVCSSGNISWRVGDKILVSEPVHGFLHFRKKRFPSAILKQEKC